MENNEASAVPVPPPSVKYAGFWVRYVAAAVDGLVLVIPVIALELLIGVLLTQMGVSQIGASIGESIINLIITWTYYSWMTHQYGATLGKMLVGITVKSEGFEKLPLKQIIIRETVGKLLSGLLLMIGYIVAAFTQKKQALHDSLAHSVVVYKDPTNPSRVGLVVGIILAVILPIIAIVGIASSVALVALSHARSLGNDARIREDVMQVRTLVETRADTMSKAPYSYAKNCFSGIFTDSEIQKTLSSAQSKNILCYAEGSSYAVSAQLAGTDGSFCVDSTGISGAGIAVDDGKNATCQLMAEKQSPSSMVPSSVSSSTSLYSYTLPAGWVSANNMTGEGIQASNQNAGYILSIAVVPIPAAAGNFSSIKQVMNTANASQVINSEFPGTTNINVAETTIGGEDAVATSFSATVKTKSASILQYNTLHKNVSYTILFISTGSQSATSVPDFKSIVGSFTFKK